MSNTVEILAPAEQTEGTRSQVLRWLKNVGDSVVEHEPLIEIETDKVTVEVAAPATGTLREILKNEQEEIAPGEVLGRLELEGSLTLDDVSAQAAVTSAKNLAAGAAASARTPVAANSARSDDELIAARSTANLSPAVRRLISERGLDASKIRGSGEGGRVTVDDVLAHAASTASAVTDRAEISIDDVLEPVPRAQGRDGEGGARTPSSAARRAGESVTGEGVESTPPSAARLAESKPATSTPAHQRPSNGGPSSSSQADGGIPSHAVPHTAIRKRTANHMVQSLLQTAPHVTTVFEADLTAAMAHRAKHRADFDTRGAPLTFTAYFLSASVAAIRAVPEANARWTDTALELYDVINIGVATALPEAGLVVPVLHNLENKSLFDIARLLNERVIAARAGKLQPADVRGGTFTISNHGVSGSLLAAPIIINQPQSAILGIGKLEKRPVAIEKDGTDQVIVRPKCYVTLTIDHRVMDGHQANRFLQVFVETLEAWPAD
jgi:2-oxoglutarate dehydrogenase E2 component (dihydrolipoamide succinyltransferase)